MGENLAGRVAVVTGGASGIGEACATRLAADGAAVVVADLNAGAAAAVAGRIGGRAVEVDLAADFDAAALAGQADVLVNCAGLQHVAPVHEFPPEKFRLILAVMLEAPFRLARAALPHMYEQGFGRIVNISSVHGLRASPFKSAYVAAKHGLEGLSKVIALEGGGRGVTSNTICPAYVRTPLVEKQIADQARIHGISEDRVVEEIMLDRAGHQAADRAGRGRRARRLPLLRPRVVRERLLVRARRRLVRPVAHSSQTGTGGSPRPARARSVSSWISPVLALGYSVPSVCSAASRCFSSAYRRASSGWARRWSRSSRSLRVPGVRGHHVQVVGVRPVLVPVVEQPAGHADVEPLVAPAGPARPRPRPRRPDWPRRPSGR